MHLMPPRSTVETMNKCENVWVQGNPSTELEVNIIGDVNYNVGATSHVSVTQKRLGICVTYHCRINRQAYMYNPLLLSNYRSILKKLSKKLMRLRCFRYCNKRSLSCLCNKKLSVAQNLDHNVLQSNFKTVKSRCFIISKRLSMVTLVSG